MEVVMEVKKLRCQVQHYDWGRRGRESTVAKLYAQNSAADIVDDGPYAELWMGTHESGPSLLVRSSGRVSAAASNGGESLATDSDVSEPESLSLKSWISRNPSVLGEKVVRKWGTDLPFLFKVLSVAKALSIQAHPDKDLAEALHKSQPSVYKDDNHKPEMALAITHFEALCGFITLQELQSVIRDVPEVVEMVGISESNQVMTLSDQDENEKQKSALRSIFTKLMSASKETIIETTAKLRNRLHLESQVRKLTDKERLVLELEKQYPDDIGVISAFFFNYVRLNPGEALYLGANEPHAYLSGECVECMATSDNVVRAGLTPKHRDVNTLCSMLTYKQGFPEILRGVSLNPHVTRYSPPFDEFEVDSCYIPEHESALFHEAPGPSILLVTRGDGILRTNYLGKYLISEGNVFFVPADVEISITSESEMQLYRAGVNSKFFQRS